MPPVTVTRNLGLVLPGKGNPDYQPGNAVGLLTAAILALEAGPDAVQTLTAAGTVAVKAGRVLLKAGKDAAFTLALPAVVQKVVAGSGTGRYGKTDWTQTGDGTDYPTSEQEAAVVAEGKKAEAKSVLPGAPPVAVANAKGPQPLDSTSKVVVVDEADEADEYEVTIVALDDFAYTVTTPTNGIDGTKHVATFAPGAGNHIVLVAKDGLWHTGGTPHGVWLS